MKLHKNAALSPKQRQEIQHLYTAGQVSYSQLAQKFAVSRKTVIKWAKRSDNQDRTSAPKQHHQRVTDAYRLAVIGYREANPTHGPVRIERQLRDQYGHFAPSTLRIILVRAQQQKPSRPKMEKLATGRYRTQMDVQQLPALKGGSGFDYKISIIHLSTRIKYSEIHDNYQSETIAEVFKRSMDVLPPFLSPLRRPGFTDNAMSFTMQYTAHPDRQTQFTKTVESSGRIHALIPPGKPWRNGFIERSNRTDKAELFNRERFRDSEDRRYQLKLWEMEYNNKRPHQGIDNQIPFDVYCRDYPLHAACRYTT